MAVLTGSFGSGGGGLREVLMEQKRHPLVHVSPRTYKAKSKKFTIVI